MMKIKKTKLFIAVVSVLVIAIITGIVFIVIGKESSDIILLRCNDVDITQSVYKMYISECAADFTKSELKEKGVFDIIKERALEKVKLYAFFTNECAENNINIEGTELQVSYEDYEKYWENFDSFKELGIEKKYYISFFIDLDKFDRLIKMESSKIDIEQEAIEDRFNENRLQYAKVTVKTIFIADRENEDTDERMNFMNNIKKDIVNGAKIDELIDEYSEYPGNNNGIFEVNEVSLIKNNFGNEYIESVLNSNEGDIKVLKTSTGYCLNQTIKLEKKSGAVEELRSGIQRERYIQKALNIINENSELYDVKILDEKLFNSIQLPDVLFADE